MVFGRLRHDRGSLGFKITIGYLTLISLALPLNAPGSEGIGVSTYFKGTGSSQELKLWSREDLAHLKKFSSREKDPDGGTVVAWEGVLLNDLMEKSLDPLPLAQKAQVDLLVLKNSAGTEVVLPRYLITKYPLYVAYKRGHADLETLEVVLPWTSKPAVTKEELPVESYFFPKLTGLEFTTERNRFSSLLLTRRGDPAAVRGEKYFLHHCTGCHITGPNGVSAAESLSSRTLASSGHPVVKGMPVLAEHDKKALVSYLDAFRAEHPPAAK